MMEEKLVVSRQLVLKEEIRIRKRVVEVEGRSIRVVPGVATRLRVVSGCLDLGGPDRVGLCNGHGASASGMGTAPCRPLPQTIGFHAAAVLGSNS